MGLKELRSLQMMDSGVTAGVFDDGGERGGCGGGEVIVGSGEVEFIGFMVISEGWFLGELFHLMTCLFHFAKSRCGPG